LIGVGCGEPFAAAGADLAKPPALRKAIANNFFDASDGDGRLISFSGWRFRFTKTLRILRHDA
jgi:hypothetical protein